ncbi:hypothetical protein ES708_02669 [subsurface metagenome]
MNSNMNNNMRDRWFSVDEIAEYLGVKRDTIYKWIDKKGIPAHKVGRLWKFRKDEVDEWIRSGKADDSGSTTEDIAPPTETDRRGYD